MANFAGPLGLGISGGRNVILSPGTYGAFLFSGDQVGDKIIGERHISNLNADVITAGTIDASKIGVINLNATNITAGTIDASKIGVINLNATNITAGTLKSIVIDGGAGFNDTLGFFYPIVIDASGNVTINASINHPSSIVYHNTSVVITDSILTSSTGSVNMLMAPNTSIATPFIFEVADRNANIGVSEWGFQAFVAAGGPLRLRSVAGGAPSTFYDSTGVGTFFGNLTGSATSLNGEKVRHAGGISAGSIAAGLSASGTTNFSSAFNGAPDVVAVLNNTAGPSLDLSLYVTSTSTTGFGWTIHNNDSVNASNNVSFGYVAVGSG